MELANIISWVLQIIVAIFFINPAKDNLTLSAAQFIERHQLKPGQSPTVNRIIGTLQVFGILGIILPKALNIYPILTPIAAIGFCLMMLSAAFIHRNDPNKKLFFIVLLMAFVNLIIVVLNRQLF